jgi:hypothetical protein
MASGFWRFWKTKKARTRRKRLASRLKKYPVF